MLLLVAALGGRHVPAGLAKGGMPNSRLPWYHARGHSIRTLFAAQIWPVRRDDKLGGLKVAWLQSSGAGAGLGERPGEGLSEASGEGLSEASGAALGEASGAALGEGLGGISCLQRWVEG